MLPLHPPLFALDSTSALLVFLLVAFWLYRSHKQREADENEQDPRPKRALRGPGVAYSAGRDAAHKGARFQQIFVPMEPEEEQALRTFYLQELGLTEMRAPNYPKDVDGFWAVSGSRQIYFGTQPSFAFDTSSPPSFPLAKLEQVAARLTAAGYETAWDRSIPYVKRLVVTDPAGTQIALIGA